MKELKDEYCKKFGLCKQKGTCQCKKELKFLEDTIAQAEQEMLKRVVGEIEMLEVSCVDDRLLGRSDEYLDGYNTSTERWRKERDDLLSSLEKEIKDN